MTTARRTLGTGPGTASTTPEATGARRLPAEGSDTDAHLVTTQADPERQLPPRRRPLGSTRVGD